MRVISRSGRCGFRLHPRCQRLLLSLSIPSVLAVPVQAQELALTDVPLKEVVVTATRSSQAVESIPGTVTIISHEEMERRPLNDIADVLADEPDVAMPRDVRRFGSGTINIRGIEDNRVLLLIDGVRATDARSPGSTNYDGANRDLPDADFLKQVEIVRGPGSSLYGSDAIGGVVGFLTLDPQDFLKDGRTQASGFRLRYFGEDDSRKGTAYLAKGDASLRGLLMVSTMYGHETETKGTNDAYGFLRTKANPQDITSTSLLGKLDFEAAPGHRFKLALEVKDKKTDTDVDRISNMSGTSLSRISANGGRDTLNRQRLSLDYVFSPDTTTWFDLLTAKAFWQSQKSHDDNDQSRSKASMSTINNATQAAMSGLAIGTQTGCSASTTGTFNCTVNQAFRFKQSNEGVSVVMEKNTEAVLKQSLTWGADWLRTQTEEVKSTTWTNLATGMSSNFFLGEAFPKSEYPKGHMDQLGIFFQDEIHLYDGKLRLIPGVRYDSFDLKPESDGMYHPVTGATAASKSGSRISSKFAANLEVAPGWNAYAQYVEGFRAPSYEQVNRYFLNATSLYGIVGNPNLKPETSVGTEVGLKAGDRNLGFQVAAFDNRYSDFIDYVKLNAGDPALLPAPYTITYQYRNLSGVTIGGVELRGHWQANRDWKFSAAYASAKGDYKSNGSGNLPLNSVEPDRLSLSALWTPTDGWGGEMRLRAARKKDRIDNTSGALFQPGGYSVIDLGAWWQVQPGTKLSLGISNLLDKKFWLWSDIRRASLPSSDPAADFYTQPGRNISLSLQMDF